MRNNVEPSSPQNAFVQTRSRGLEASKHGEDGGNKNKTKIPNLVVLRNVVLRERHPVQEPESCSLECIHPLISLLPNMDASALPLKVAWMWVSQTCFFSVGR